MTALEIIAITAATVLAAAAALAVLRSRRARSEMQGKIDELTSGGEQLRLLNRFSHMLTQESERRGVARAATGFFSRELGGGRAVIWKPDRQGEPQAPWVSFPEDGDPEAPTPLPEAQRIILARAAARGRAPLILRGDSQDQRPHPLRLVDAPDRGFALYVPLGGSRREGVLEVYCGRQPWGRERWELLGPLTLELTGALRRARHYEELRAQADRDFVTGLFNHRFMQVYLQRLVETEAAGGRGFALLLMDVDNFKSFNDCHGHAVGDRVLQFVADQLKLMTDRVGTVGRFGGDEFIVVLGDHTRAEACAFAQAFQDWLTTYSFRTPAGQALPIALSWGPAAFPEDGSNRQELLAAADVRLYQCKRSGSQTGTAGGHSDSSNGLGVFGLLDGLVTSVDRKDHYSRAHCESTAEYAAMLAQEVDVSPSAQRTLRLAALLHDVGKICIPDHLLRKPGRLTAEEYAVIKHHVSIVENLIVDVPNAEEVREIARHHHERFDGSGYPDGLKGEDIPLLARVLALADAFAAMTLDRPHRRGLPPGEAYAELQRAAGAQLDPELVREFGRAIASSQPDATLSPSPF